MRLALLYGLACLLVLGAGLLWRGQREADGLAANATAVRSTGLPFAGVTVELRNRIRRDAAAPGEPTTRGVTLLYTDPAGNQTAVIRHERTWVMSGPYGSLDELLK